MRRSWPLGLLLLLLAAAFLLRSDWRDPPASGERSLPAATPVEGIVETAAPIAAVTEADPPGEAVPETEDAVLGSLKWLLNHQNPDGSWGDGPVTLDGHTLGPTGVTALALLAYLGAGYSHLSKDTYDGKCMGDAVRRALQFLMKDQQPDGTFASIRDGGFDQALGALSLSEAYGLTGSSLFKDQAQAAVDALCRMQSPDGSWGGPAPTVWAAEALYSARISGLEQISGTAENLLRSFRSEWPDARETFARAFLERKKEEPRLALGADLLLRRKPHWDEQDFTYWYHGSYAMYDFDGPSGPRWKAWNEDMKNALVRNQTREGTWPGGTQSHTVVRTSLAQLTLEVYYRMANVFGSP